MKKCPACNARMSGKSECHRCKADLSKLLGLEERASVHRDRAMAYFLKQDNENMLKEALRFYTLYKNPESVKLLATAAVSCRQFQFAFDLWRKLNQKA